MADKTHHYEELDITWTGNTGTGTSGYRDYERARRLCFIANSVNFEVRCQRDVVIGGA